MYTSTDFEYRDAIKSLDREELKSEFLKISKQLYNPNLHNYEFNVLNLKKDLIQREFIYKFEEILY